MKSASESGYEKPKCDKCGGDLRLDCRWQKWSYYPITKTGKKGKVSVLEDDKDEFLFCLSCNLEYEVCFDDLGRPHKDGEGQDPFSIPNARIT